MSPAQGLPTPSPRSSPELLAASSLTLANSESRINRSPSPSFEAERLQPVSNKSTHSRRYSWPPTGAVIIHGDGTAAYPFIVNATDWTPTGCKVLSGDGIKSEPFKIDEGEEEARASTATRAVTPTAPRCPSTTTRFRRRSAPSSPMPKGVQKRSSSCPPRFSARQKQQIANLLLGGRDNPIDLS